MAWCPAAHLIVLEMRDFPAKHVNDVVILLITHLYTLKYIAPNILVYFG